ncbi:pyruvate, phosphate dikinase [Candidatus Peregrinibacteria bacterium CG_4_9_14_0_2_um_filter_53_11]|nr:MAG: pyruvate, phosphate dikinase [Candidatus Peregrinibacteria bacterium CG_4_9_14_0_2_um_filter_53_11]
MADQTLNEVSTPDTYIYAFHEGAELSKELLGGKGAVLAQMTSFGLPVPPGFTVTTQACSAYLERGAMPTGFWEAFDAQLKKLEEKMGKGFGSDSNPLLVSVRSGAAISMPGMMDTVLNLGLNDSTVEALAHKTGNPRFCWDAYRRFVQMYGNVVLGIDHHAFESLLEDVKASSNKQLDTQLDEAELRELVRRYKQVVQEKTRLPFPDSPREQMEKAIIAVFSSWNNKRAITYRKIHKITGLLGTAVTIQSMVFGNMGESSGTGVAFTRNPSNGEKEFYGEFLINAQGEDVVAGIRTPQKIDELERLMPTIYAQLVEIKETLEKRYRNMQDIEFTVEEGRLYILQTRNGKRTAAAAVRIATEMVSEGLISRDEAILQVDALQLNQLLHPCLPADHGGQVLTKGLPASPGAAVGVVTFSPEEAYELSEKGRRVILVRRETSPEDIQGMYAAQGILTSTGGMTSHAAVVCRGMGKPCIAGCASLKIDYPNQQLNIDGRVIEAGEVITLDGTTGEVILGEIELAPPVLNSHFKELMGWVDERRDLRVRTNADCSEDAGKAREFGAEGIGLCRTEHMFFQDDRISKIREMILAKNEEGRRKALSKLLPLQKADFKELFNVMDGFPVTIRLLDPPLHEFIPTTPEQMGEMAKLMEISTEELTQTAAMLHEVNPMLGHRGCRLAMTYPEITEMQVQAIVEAAIEVRKSGVKVIPEIEVPFVGMATELKMMRQLIQKVVSRYAEALGDLQVKIGTMIELPRACLTADEIAPHADFFSFGTNDLTQMTFGMSRDDAGKFLPHYLENAVTETDPTETIDRQGVGRLMQICVDLARQEKPELEMGICGEHGGDPRSVEFCHLIGLDYVSCSPYRVPIAKVAAAQAAIRHPRTTPTA